MERPRKGIQSIEVGGRLLVALSRHGGAMMLRDLAREAGMSAAKAHPYLVSFTKIGLVEQDAATSRYRLGGLALTLGLASLQQSDPIRLAAPAMVDLKERVQHTAALAVWGNHGPTIVQLEAMDHPFHVNLRVGTVMSLVTTATGRVFAAYLPAPVVQPPVAEEIGRVTAASADAKALRRVFDAEVADIRRRGFGRAIGSPIPGVNAFSAPVFDHTGAIVLVITLTGPAGTFDASWESPIAAALVECCAALSRRLGAASA